MGAWLPRKVYAVMRMMLVYLTGSLRGRTQFIDTDYVTFGVGGDCGITFDPAIDAMVCPFHAELSVVEQTPIIRDRSGKDALLVNGEHRSEAALRDGDLIQFGPDGPQVRFRLTSDALSDTKPLRTIVADSRDIVVRSPHPLFLSPFYLIRHILRDIAVHASPAVRLGAVLLVLIPLVVILALGIGVYRQHERGQQSEQRMAELISQLETGRVTRAQLEERIEVERRAAAELHQEQEAKIAQLTQQIREKELVKQSQQELGALRQQLSGLQQGQQFAEQIARQFEGSVGLVQGSYGFKEPKSGRRLRYQGLDQLGLPFVDNAGNALVTLEGTAPVVEIFYAGTAFVVDRQGTVLTNRHVVHMWETFEPAQQAIRSGLEPEPTMLRLFLPGGQDPFDLRLLSVSDRSDLALLRMSRIPAKSDLPTPQLQEGEVRVGEPIVMLSYPGSFETLIARLPKAVSQDIVAAAGSDPSKLAEELARRNVIRPLATQGHVSAVSEDLITYEGGSASGSSGAPVFNRAGTVIGINHATLPRVGGVHLAVPVRFAKDLLQHTKAGKGP